MEGNECGLCREMFETKELAAKHENRPAHKQKLKVEQFLNNEVPNNCTKASSHLLERYQIKNLPIVGLTDVVEIQTLGVADTNFWICSICHDVGSTYEEADAHLQSLKHILTFFDENEPSIKQKMEVELSDPDDKCEKYEKYREAAELYYNENKPLQGPEIIRTNMSAADGMKRFDLKDNTTISFQHEGNKTVLHCGICNEVCPVHTSGKSPNDKARQRHCTHANHVRRAAIISTIKEFEPKEMFEEYTTNEQPNDLHWCKNEENGNYYLSQPCGYRYSYNAGSETICAICCCLVTTGIKEHFSSEFHAMKYLTQVHSYNAFIALSLKGEARREKALKIFQAAYSLENETRCLIRCASRFPKNLKSQLAEDVHKYEDVPLIVIDDFKESTGKMHILCQSCTTYIEFDTSSADTPEKLETAWFNHVNGDLHFETSAMKARVNFDSKFYVPHQSNFAFPDNERKGDWSMHKDVLVQNQCAVGLEYMVEDEIEEEVVCQCCWQVFSKNLVSAVNTHVKSYDHLKQYIFHQNPEITKILLGPDTDISKRKLLLDFLQRNSGAFQKRMIVHSKFKSLELATWSSISRRYVETSVAVNNANRDVYETVLNLVDSVAEDSAENGEMTAKEALIVAQMVITNTARGNDKELKSIVCRCVPCDQLVVANSATWQDDIFTNHICTDEHYRRAEQLKSTSISVFGICPEKSTYTVKPFVQKDLTKKVVWQWNATSKQHEYVGSIVGLDDIIEWRYMTNDPISPKKAEFFCQLCAKMFPKRAIELETHVREMEHCINFMMKYRPLNFREFNEMLVNQHLDKGKELRKYLSGQLREVHPTQDYCIKIYDPSGEAERSQMEVVIKMQEEEKQRRIIETRERIAAEKERLLKEHAERRKADEERREKERLMQLESLQRHQEIERQRQAERAERLQFAKENAKRLAEKATKEAEEKALKNRLQQASLLELQRIDQQKINVQQKRLEVERMQLMKRMGKAASTDPQLGHPGISPSLFSTPPPTLNFARPDFGTPHPVPQFSPFGFPPPPVQQHNPYAMDPSGGFSMNFNARPPPDSPAVVKRPTLRGKQVDPMIHDTRKIKNKADLLDYMHSREATRIIDAEIPLEFSRTVQDCEEAIGIDLIAEVICLDDPNLDSYLCTACNCWMSPIGMFNHMKSTEHKSTFLRTNYPDHFNEVNRERNRELRNNIFKNFLHEMKRKQIGAVLRLRMNTIIDKATIERLWPGYEDHFDQRQASGSWSTGGFREVSAPSIALPKVVPVTNLFADEEEDLRRGGAKRRERSRSRDRRRSRTRSNSRSRSRSRERDYRSSRRRSSRSRSRSRSRDRSRRDYRDRRHGSPRNRSRDRSRSHDRSSSRNHDPKAPGNKWMEQTDSFLAQLGEIAKNSAETKKPEDYLSQLAAVRELTKSGVIKGTSVDLESKKKKTSSAKSDSPFAAPVDEKRIAKEKEEQEMTKKRKMMAAMFMMERLVQENNGMVSREEINKMYESIGLNPDEGDREINKLIQDMGNKQVRLAQ
uniref:C2H2-type domain-containing protein n=1 Tax=Caenorhabditis japonica TaxID=281687 RepID=A0A8R1HYB1_CAEJA